MQFVAMRLLGILVMAILFAAASANGATLEGTIYDYSLAKVDHAVVEISTEPVQRQVTVNGKYHFEAPPGYYAIQAQSFRKMELMANATQAVSIISEGRFNLDLILAPAIDINEEPVQELDIDSLFDNETAAPTLLFTPGGLWRGFGVLVILLLLGAGVWASQRTRSSSGLPSPKETHEQKPDQASLRPDLGALLRIVREQDGRSTQREIRRALPFSEAKISLMLAELEDAGTIRKIKKGRGNIVILNEKRQKPSADSGARQSD